MTRRRWYTNRQKEPIPGTGLCTYLGWLLTKFQPEEKLLAPSRFSSSYTHDLYRVYSRVLIYSTNATDQRFCSRRQLGFIQLRKLGEQIHPETSNNSNDMEVYVMPECYANAQQLKAYYLQTFAH